MFKKYLTFSSQDFNLRETTHHFTFAISTFIWNRIENLWSYKTDLRNMWPVK